MATIEQLEQALIKAHRAGDERAAKLISGRIETANADTYMGAPSEDATFGEKVVGGLKHAWDKAAYGLEGAVKGVLGQDITKEHKQHLEQGKAFVEKGGAPAKVAEFAGDVLPYLTLGRFGVSRGFTLPQSMAAQAAAGATLTPESMGERMKSGLYAGLGEGAGHVLANTMGRLVGGVKNIDPAAQRMIEEGVYPTYGGLKGGVVKDMEDRLMSVPGFGNAVQYGRKGAIEEGNIAAMNRGLPEGTVTKAGYEGQGQLAEHFNKVFGDSLKGVRFDLSDPALQQAIEDTVRSNGLTRDAAEGLNNFFVNQRYQRGIPEATAPGTNVIPGNLPPPVPTYISGDDFHAIMQDLRKESAGYRKNPNSNQNDIKTGNAYRKMYDEIQRLARQQGASDKGALDAFDAARRQYASVAPAIRAGNLSTVAGQKGGIFSPRQYANQNAANMKAQGQTQQLRTGKGYNQQFGSDMVKTLGSDYPDSGTVGRSLAAALVMGEAAFAPKALALSALGYGMNTPTARRYMAGALPGQQAMSNAIRSYGPQLGYGTAALGGAAGSDY